MRRTLPWLFLLLAMIAGVARAQTVRWQSADTGDPSDIELAFENTAPATSTPPQLPQLPDGASLTFIGPRTETSMVLGPGGASSRRLVYLMYRARSRNGEAFDIPAFTVQTTNGSAQVPAYKVGAVPQVSASVARSTLTPGSPSVFAGEVFPLAYTLDVATRNVVQLSATVGWTSAPLVAEDWSRPEPSEANVNGESRTLVSYRTRAYAKTPGRITLDPVRQEMSIQTGTLGMGFLQQPRLQTIAVTSSRPEITVKPLPAGAPAGFAGAVGQFTLASKILPESVAVGEPITWTLSLQGQGNWPEIAGLPGRDVSRAFQVVQPAGKRTMAEGKMFDGEFTEDVVLVPTRAGSYDLGPIRFSYFDPKTGRYETAVCEKITVVVKGDPNAAPPPVAQGAQDPRGGGAEAVSGGTPPPPGPPGVIPRDPLPGSGTAIRPMPQRVAIAVAAVPVVLLAALWMGLALARARTTDPLRARRAARAEMLAVTRRLRESPAPEQRATLLRKWQASAALLWEIDHAAPSAHALARISGPGGTAGKASEWESLWAEADRAIYGRAPDLPANWPERADAALLDKRVARFSPLQLFLPRNLVPLAIVAAAGLALAGALEAAEAPEAEYRKGGFAAAEKGWRARAAGRTNDWIARHNLALALLQQDKGPEAAAHAAAAFVQRPRDPSVRWHLAPIFEKSAYTPEPLVPFINPTLGPRIARAASAAEWQWILAGSSLVGCAGAGWLLRRAYAGRATAGARVAGASAIVLGLALAAVAFASHRAYGDAADRRAVIAWRPGVLRSIPTEADEAQKTTTVNAGSVAVAGETFLTWQKLTFGNGQTGWARKSDFVPLW